MITLIIDNNSTGTAPLAVTPRAFTGGPASAATARPSRLARLLRPARLGLALIAASCASAFASTVVPTTVYVTAPANLTAISSPRTITITYNVYANPGPGGGGVIGYLYNSSGTLLNQNGVNVGLPLTLTVPAGTIGTGFYVKVLYGGYANGTYVWPTTTGTSGTFSISPLAFRILVDTNTMTLAEAQQIISPPAGSATLAPDGAWAANIQGQLVLDNYNGNGALYNISSSQWQSVLTKLNASSYLVTEDDLLDVVSGRPPAYQLPSDFTVATNLGFSVNAAMVYYENWEGVLIGGTSVPLSDSFAACVLMNNSTAPTFQSGTQTWTQMTTNWNSATSDQIAVAFGSGSPALSVHYQGNTYTGNSSVIAGRAPIVINTRSFTDSASANNVSAPNPWPDVSVASNQWHYYTAKALAEPVTVCSGVSYETTYDGVGADTANCLTSTLNAGKTLYLLLDAKDFPTTGLTYKTQVQTAVRNLASLVSLNNTKIVVVLANYGSSAGFLADQSGQGNADNSILAALAWLKDYRNGAQP